MAESAQDTQIAGKIVDGIHQLPIRIYYEDTDFSGIVYHAAYLKFCERGRSDFLRLLGIHHFELSAGKYGEQLAFAVRKMEIDFLKSAQIDDILMVHTQCKAVKGASVELAQKVYCDDNLLLALTAKIALINDQLTPRRIPTEIADKLKGQMRG